MRSNEILCHIDVALFTLHVGDGCGGKRALHVDLALPVTIGPRRNADGNPRTTLIYIYKKKKKKKKKKN